MGGVVQLTPTSDERRKVAARLRTEVGEDECIDYAVFRIINDALLINGAWGAKAARILADLIDPTCKVSSVETYDDELGQLEGWEFHLTCGHSFQRPWNEPPAYCPECGARVVDKRLGGLK